MNRRRYLGLLGSGVTASLTGCSAIIDGLLDVALEDVNVATDSEEPVTIQVEIADLDGTMVFEESAFFEGVDGDDEEATEQYEDVWQETGEYRVRADLEDGPVEIETIEIEETDDPLLVLHEDDEIEIGFFENLADDE